MTRLDFLHLVVARARSNGFEFRRWYTQRLGLPWINAAAALQLLDAQRRYYALLFSHEFALAFWAPGSEIILELPVQVFESVMPDGTVRTIRRRQHLRRSTRPEAWKYHLRQMASTEEPLRYLRRFIHIEDQLDADVDLDLSSKPKSRRAGKATPKAPVTLARIARPLPTGTPAFLKRPYSGSATFTGKPADAARQSAKVASPQSSLQRT